MAGAPAIQGWSPPSSFDEYRLTRLLGRGSMGQIYLAQDTLLDRPVAVKFIASIRPDVVARRRFQREARTLARLSHPNVVAVHRIGEVAGRPYLVAEFVRGTSLADHPKPVPWEAALHIAMGVARGLGAAHRAGVLHRDIKPANIMLASDGEVKLIDFGLAKLIAEPIGPGNTSSFALPPLDMAEAAPDGPASASGAHDASTRDITNTEIVGTLLYMAAEVFRGEPATRKSDIYSAGSVLYELCAGVAQRDTVPHDVPIEVVIESDPTPLTALAKGIDPRFAAVISRCLQGDPERRFASAEALLEALEQIDPEEDASAIPEGNPYRGLAPFEAEHRALYFGRNAEIRAVLERMRAEPIVLIAGDSGVGKSSLCRAGVVPRIEEGALGDGRAWRAVTLVPGARPVAALIAALAPVVGLSEDALSDTAAADPASIGRVLQRSTGHAAAVLLCIDQLEEIFTLGDPEEAARFGELVARLGSTAAGVRVLATVRGDYFTRLAGLPGLGEEIARALYLLRPLSPEAARAAITGPARRKAVTFESEALVDALVESVAQTSGGLPLLQFAMAELWETRDVAAQQIPASALEAIGGVAGALARHADGVVERLASEHQSAARRVLVRLVTAEGTRARRTAAELGRDTAANAALEALIQGRLIVAREIGGETAYEVAHEALLQGWATLRGWLETDREQRRMRERVEVAAAEWARLGGAAEALWSRRQLAEVAQLDDGELAPREKEFLTASKRRIQRARLVRWAAGLAVPLGLGIAVSAVSLLTRHDLDRRVGEHEARAESRAQEGRRLKTEADSLRRRAFTLFDAPGDGTTEEATARTAEAERIWASALDASRRAEAELVLATQALEGGLALDAARVGLRAALGDLCAERIEIARWFYHEERQSELHQRLQLYDEDGTRRLRLAAPPRLSIETSPPDAEVSIDQYQVEDGYRRLKPLGSLGRTPLPEVKIAAGPGSYLLRFSADGRVVVRLPILLERDERVQVAVTLPATGDVPAGFVYVPQGRFLYGSAEPEGLRRGLISTQPEHEFHTGAYLIGRTEVTFAEWIRFLEDLPKDARQKHTPSARNRQWGVELEEIESGEWQLALVLNNQRVTAREGEPIRIAGRTRRIAQDWLRFPVSAVSAEDAIAYMDWLRRAKHLPGARLCSEHEWERAARGADGRAFPHGDRLAPDDANFDETYARVSNAFGPDEVGSHEASASPFGVQDMTGNVYEWTRSAITPGGVVTRGGAWYYDQISVQANNRTIGEPKTRDFSIGVRVCADLPAR